MLTPVQSRVLRFAPRTCSRAVGLFGRTKNRSIRSWPRVVREGAASPTSRTPAPPSAIAKGRKSVFLIPTARRAQFSAPTSQRWRHFASTSKGTSMRFSNWRKMRPRLSGCLQYLHTRLSGSEETDRRSQRNSLPIALRCRFSHLTFHRTVSHVFRVGVRRRSSRLTSPTCRQVTRRFFRVAVVPQALPRSVRCFEASSVRSMENATPNPRGVAESCVPDYGRRAILLQASPSRPPQPKCADV